MCVTVLATPAIAAAERMLLGKNSDRQRNEAQGVEIVPGADHEPGDVVRCTYVTVAQAPRTATVLLSRPCWIWGAEMGANEHGVAIGNKGLDARVPAPENPALTGMDLVRLALERAASAAEAVDVITTLLARHGQGGNCGHLFNQFYHNGFLIADREDAFVLETVGRDWVLAPASGIRGLSNAYSIGADATRASAGMDALVSHLSPPSAGTTPDYAALIADRQGASAARAADRRERAEAALGRARGAVGARDLMRALRDHGETPAKAGNDGAAPDHTPAFTVCQHAWSWMRGQTVGSLVAALGGAADLHWVTGTAAPCLSLFKPVVLDMAPAQLAALTGPFPTDRFDPRSLWWRHERLHRRVIGPAMHDRLARIAAERDTLEAAFEAHMAEVTRTAPERRAAAAAACWREAEAAEARWLSELPATMQGDEGWAELNRIAGFR